MSKSMRQQLADLKLVAQSDVEMAEAYARLERQQQALRQAERYGRADRVRADYGEAVMDRRRARLGVTDLVVEYKSGGRIRSASGR